MALKYFFEYRSFRENLWRVEIDSPTYTDDPIEIQGTDKPLTIEWNGDSDDDPFKAHIINSTIQMNVYNKHEVTGAELDINEIMLINDSSYKVRVYLNSSLHWQGSLISDGVRENDNGVAYPVTLKAIDGIELLDNTYYSGNPGWGDITVNGQLGSRISILQRIRGILYRNQELDNILPIRWSCSLKNLYYPTDDAIGGRTAIDGRGWLTNPNVDLASNENKKSSFWWLKNLVQSVGCWLVQREGYWYIISYADMINNNGTLNFYEITTSTLDQVASTVTINLNEDCNDSVNENGFWWVKKPFGSVKVTYQNTTLQGDVMPNGSFDRTSLGMVLDWRFDPQAGTITLVENAESLSERQGNSVLITNTGESTETAIFTYANTIPLDSWKLFKNFTFGFTFAPYFGFQYDTNGIISWDNKPLQISVSFTYKGATWYLNEFGFWWNKDNAKILQTFTARWDVPTYNDYIISFPSDIFFQAGDIVRFRFLRNGTFEDYEFIFNEITSPQDARTRFINAIPNSQAFVFTTPPIPLGIIIYGVTNTPLNTITTGKTQESIEKISVSVAGAKIKDIISFAFTGKGGNSEILLPEINNYTSGDGELKVKFFVKPGQQYGLDDVYFKVPQNNDIYTVSLSDSKNSKEEYTMDISSSFSGHLLSSYGAEYQDKNENMFWTGNKTLTQIYGESILKWRNKPCRVFEGSVDGRINWGLLDVRGIKYVPLIINFDAIDEISNITAIQARQDSGLSMSVKHTSSGDKL